jgi:hypothetical protein
VERRATMEFEVDGGDSLIGIKGLDQPTVIDSAFSSLPHPQRRYRCWQCGEALTRRDTRTGIVGATVRTSKFGTRRVAVHADCEDDVMNEGMGLF